MAPPFHFETRQVEVRTRELVAQAHWRTSRGGLPSPAVSSAAASPKQASAESPGPRTELPHDGGPGRPEGPGAGDRAEVADAALVARMVQGDRSAIAALYERHVACLLALGHSLLRDKREAEDLIHDVFLEAWRHSADYSAERGTVRTWLLIRARSRALDRLKSIRPRQAEAADLDRLEGARAASDADAHALLGDQERLRRTLSQMPEAQREVIWLGYFEGLSTTEMASRLGIPAGTVKSRTRSALSTLRSLLAGHDE
jgi:RNA polymerase sigma-70 factor, ECF subfamily